MAALDLEDPVAPLEVEEPRFALQAPAITGELGVGSDDPVAGHDDGDGIATDGCAHRPSRARAPDAPGNLSVADCHAVGDLQQGIPHVRLEWTPSEGQQHVEAGSAPLEVAFKLASNWSELRLIEHPGVGRLEAVPVAGEMQAFEGAIPPAQQHRAERRVGVAVQDWWLCDGGGGWERAGHTAIMRHVRGPGLDISGRILDLSGYVRLPGPVRSMIWGVTGFSAVVTTGIYCRPDCTARPDPRNVRHFQTAAAAEAAGFRACQRCRPYRSDPLVSWTAPELVCRSVQLVLGGALDGGTEADLGARLGVSPRHLRRLFKEHLGVTPDQLARSRRAHFARRLLDDTVLTITEVAFAAGFGSVRQFNRASQDTFRAAPRALRARRRATDRLDADGGLTLRLYHEPPLAWETLLTYFRARAISGVEHVSGDTYRRTTDIDGDPGVLELSPGGPDHLVLRAHLPHWEGLIHHVQRARGIFNLDADVSRVADRLGHDALIGPLIEVCPGLRPPGTWDPFETGVRAIIGQQVSVAAANTITARVVERHGTPVAGLRPLGLTHLFPTAEILATADLSGLGLTGARQRAIGAFALAVAEATIDLDRSRTLDQLVTSITAIPGLGTWTAHYLALRMGEIDAFPATDLGLRRALGSAIGRNVSSLDCDAQADRWRPHRAAAATYLWLAQAPAKAEQAS